MVVKVSDIDAKTFNDLFLPCKGCVYWEYPGKCGKVSSTEGSNLKLQWFERMWKIFGSCGKILYMNDKAVAYCQFAPPHHIENIGEYEKYIHAVSEDSVIITCLYVKEGYRGNGLGRRILENVIEEIRRKGYKLIETFARDDSSDNPSGPSRFYLANGFEKVACKTWENARFSLLRLKL